MKHKVCIILLIFVGIVVGALVYGIIFENDKIFRENISLSPASDILMTTDFNNWNRKDPQEIVYEWFVVNQDTTITQYFRQRNGIENWQDLEKPISKKSLRNWKIRALLSCKTKEGEKKLEKLSDSLFYYTIP